ncbi:uncharacterized protein LOC114297006 [Camellia sinensis]|uniref:uncharacterized protein LOC114297006 n=1 Tax=Camellia sinensis TaxID=4442 RepID=UPI001036CF3B|nr:uncharacterized protein LOC114297006 [Camellia sinensis]
MDNASSEEDPQDLVMVTRGKDRGGTGVVKHVIHSQNCLIVEGKNQPLSFTQLETFSTVLANFLKAPVGPKDTPMDLVFEKTYDAKTGKGMPDPINLLFNFVGDI